MILFVSELRSKTLDQLVNRLNCFRAAFVTTVLAFAGAFCCLAFAAGYFPFAETL